MTTITAATKDVQGPDDRLHASLTRVFADLMRAFLECSDEVQNAIIEMAQIVNDPDADPDDQEMALATIQEALFPKHHNGNLGADISEIEQDGSKVSPEVKAVIAELDEEERQFAIRVQRLMDARGMTQGELADLSGVGQPAISMMLSRNCRPQRRTVIRIAQALGLTADDLWPSC
jgi:DNA-binding phage protein